MKIGILGAMLEEVSSIREIMRVEEEITYAGRSYVSGVIDSHQIVLTFSKWGKVASASTTSTLINKFNVDYIIFTGVAGAVDEHLNIGDIVVGNGFYQHDMDARPFFNKFQIPLTDTILFTPSKTNVSRGCLASEQFLKKIDTAIESTTLEKYSILKPSVYCGVIASGDQFISDPKSHEALAYENGLDQKTLAVEMEGAAVAQVCYEHDIPFIVFRTISDKADHSAAIDFQSFISDIASKYSSGIIRKYLDLMESNSVRL